MGEKKQFSTPNAYARNRRGRKAAGIIGLVCASAIGVAALISFLLPSTGFVTKIDYQKKAEEAALLSLRGTRSGKGGDGDVQFGQGTETVEGKEGTQILKAQSLTSALPETAETILAYYDEQKEAGSLDGAQLVRHSSQPEQYGGIFYTFYLSNSSTDKELGYGLSLNYSNYQAGVSDYVGTSLYSYLRILICIQEGDAAESHYWFAMSSSTQNAEGDAREAISKYSPDINGVRSANYSDGEVSYCEPFKTEEKLLGRVPNLSIKPGGETRFTVVVYLEGEDPDCKGIPNIGESLAIEATFALN